MDAKMTTALQRHEQDFLVSYRGHMHRVQKELGQYKRQLTEREFLMRRDKLVVQLEAGVEWFKKEALDLRKKNRALHERVASLSERCRALNGERQALSQASASAKEENNQLRRALKMTQINCRELLDQLKRQHRVNALKDFVTVQEMAVRSARKEDSADLPGGEKE